MPKWLKTAVFYEIYPNSFLDTNQDGYGDFKGITQKLPYIKDLGCNALWINPMFDSPFMDGGYDIKDFFKVSKRFGTLDDFKDLLQTAKELNIKVCLDLVAGHVSEEHELFLKSASPLRNEFSDMFVWNDNPWDLGNGQYRFISGRHQRHGNFLVNFFSTQPAINYGFYQITEPKWQISYKDPRCLKQREYLKSIIRFWFDLGVAGFRVDMADSLVKNDPDKIATIELWQDVFQEIKKDYPENIFISEWSSPNAIKAGFDIDFILDHWHNFLNRLVRYEDAGEISVFDRIGRGDAKECFKVFNNWYQQIRGKGKIGLISCNHDTPRLGGKYTHQQLKIIYATLFFMPGIPFIYYGDEIGMIYQKGMPSIECGFQRTGTRTPMQWDNSKHRGFSSAEKTFLPTENTHELSVATQLNDPNSLLNSLKQTLAFRANNEDLLQEDFNFINEFKSAFAYQRGQLTVIVNPTETAVDYPLKSHSLVVYQIGQVKEQGNLIHLEPFSLTVTRKESK